MSWPESAERGWFHSNFECVMPADPTEAAQYEAELADEAINGPAAGMETP